jgi:hypothetical protein
VEIDLNLKELIEKEKNYLALVGTLKSNNLFETLFKIYSIKKILSDFEPDSEITEEDLIVSLEEFPVPYTHSEMFRLIESVHVLEKNVKNNTYRIIRNKLFNWDEVPGNHSENLIAFLMQNYSIEWVKTAKIEKINQGTTIKIFSEQKFISLNLNNEKNKVNLKMDDGSTDELLINMINGGLYVYAASISFSALFDNDSSLDAINISIKNYIKNLHRFDETSELQKEGVIGIGECIAVILKTGEWAYEIISKSDLQAWHGIPVFWNCEKGEHSTVGNLPGPFATIDTALLVLEGLHFGFMPSSSPEKIRLLNNLFNEIRSFQIKTPGYDHGGFFLNDDNDFPMAECPIVDTTAEALFALLLVLEFDNRIRKTGDNIIGDRQVVISEINKGVDFLLRMQCEDGSWGLYNYEVKPDFKYTTQPRDFSCMLTVAALTGARKSGNISEKKVKEIDEAIDQLVGFLLRTVRHKDDLVLWTTNFSEKDDESKDCVNVTTKIIHTLMIIMEALPGYREKLETFVISGVKYIEKEWMPSGTNMAKLEFRVPTMKGFYSKLMPWEQPADALIVSFLLEFGANFNYHFKEKTWGSINRAIFNFISTNKHGHWSDLLLDEKAFPSNTLYFHRALLTYLYYHKVSLNDTNALSRYPTIENEISKNKN